MKKIGLDSTFCSSETSSKTINPINTLVHRKKKLYPNKIDIFRNHTSRIPAVILKVSIVIIYPTLEIEMVINLSPKTRLI